MAEIIDRMELSHHQRVELDKEGVTWLEGKVLTALDTGGFAALVELLTVYHLDSVGGFYHIDETQEGM